MYDNNTNNTVENNYIIVSGKVVGKPTFSHESFYEKFYDVKLEVERLSGTVDLLPICISEHLLDDRFYYNDNVTIEGQIRTYNFYNDEKHHMKIVVFATNVLKYGEREEINTVKLNCYLCKQTDYRITPLGRAICDLLVAVNRKYHKSDYIPCIAWGRNAKVADLLKVGTPLVLEGRLQSREYKKTLENGETEIRTAYELSVSKITIDKQ